MIAAIQSPYRTPLGSGIWYLHIHPISYFQLITSNVLTFYIFKEKNILREIKCARLYTLLSYTETPPPLADFNVSGSYIAVGRIYNIGDPLRFSMYTSSVGSPMFLRLKFEIT